MDIFEIILSPFVFIIKQLFEFSYGLTGNYGIAIILLSFFISALLLPVFILIEKAKKKDDVIKRKMQPLVDEIKRVYKGQERYYYLKTLNRQHNYSPFKALVPILSLLLQIPFFIAAYQYLEHLEALQGISFWFVGDLSLADGLLGGVNFLPIAMTLVNLLTAYFYTRNSSKAELKQMLIVALVFLVLLYSLPAALLLYWTMNNVFSFFRLFVTNPEVFRKSNEISIQTEDKISFKQKLIIFFPNFRIIYIYLALIISSIQINWAFQHSFDDIVVRLLVAIIGSVIVTVILLLLWKGAKLLSKTVIDLEIGKGIYLSLLFFVSYFYFAAQYYYTGVNTELAYISIVFLIPTQFIGLLYYYKYKDSFNKVYFRISSFVIIVLLIVQVLNLYSVFSEIEGDLSFFNISLILGEVSWLSFILPGLIISLLASFYFIKQTELDKASTKVNWTIYILSIVYIAGLVLLWDPLIVYSSFPQNFNFPAIDYLKNNFSIFVLILLGSIVLFAVLPKKIKGIFQSIALVLTLVSFVYSSIIPMDLGSLQVNFFSKEDRLAADIIYFLGEALLLIAIVWSVVWLFRSKKNRAVLIGLVVLNLLLISNSLYLSMNTGYFFSKNKEVDKKKENSIYKDKIPFSKTEKNVLYFIIDGAQGWYMDSIFKEDPYLSDVYSGFIWYPNTVSTSNYTYASVPSMIAGPNYTIANMNKDSTHSIFEKITQATRLFYKKAKDEGYYLTANSLKYSGANHNEIENYLPTWSSSWDKLLKGNIRNEMWYTRLSENALFSASPLFLKPKIYNNNKWFIKNNITSTNEVLKYEFVRLLPKLSIADSDKKNFIYLHSMFNHVPWDLITEDGSFQRDVHPYVNQKWFTELFGEWIKWMKDNDVYDNTKIILVSDHGPSWWHYHRGIERNIPVKKFAKDKPSLMEFLRLTPLLVVKDYNAKGKLKKDWRLMCNKDVYPIAFDTINPINTDSTERVITAFYTKWVTGLTKQYKYHNNRLFKVKNYVYDMKNWEEIKE